MLSLSNTLYLMTVMFACILLSYVSFEQIFDAPTLAYATAYALIFAISMLGVTACATALFLLVKCYAFAGKSMDESISTKVCSNLPSHTKSDQKAIHIEETLSAKVS